VAASTALQRGASLAIFMQELAILEGELRDYCVDQGLPSLALYTWRRPSIMSPALYHVLASDQVSMPDMSRFQDLPTLSTRIAIAYGDESYEVDAVLMGYIDCYRQIMDPPLHDVSKPLNGAATFINRVGMRTIPENLSGIPYHAVEFLHTFQLNRFVA
jgi:hypothetical protein